MIGTPWPYNSCTPGWARANVSVHPCDGLVDDVLPVYLGNRAIFIGSKVSTDVDGFRGILSGHGRPTGSRSDPLDGRSRSLCRSGWPVISPGVTRSRTRMRPW